MPRNGELPPMATQVYSSSLEVIDHLEGSRNQPLVFGKLHLRPLDEDEQSSIEQQQSVSHESEEYSRRVQREVRSKPLAKRIIKVVAKFALALSLPVIYVVGFAVAPFFFAGNSVYQGISRTPINELTGERRIDKVYLTKKFFKELALAGIFFPVSSAGLTRNIWRAGSRTLEEFCPSEPNE
ncbi:hypothetical protein GCM10023116_23100 [Kistimonas scapharcae]|uniref:Uncharacterized protein n=1 Tax=Kistimonas scapharcae TaxID=1036133 RepID=A0ABP8V532_9GAMM